MTRQYRAIASLLALGMSLGVSSRAEAHKPSDSYLTLATQGEQLSGGWDIALRDLDRVLALDTNGDGQLTWGELRVRRDELTRYALRHLQLSRGGRPCTVALGNLELVEHSDGRYARLPLSGACDATSDTLQVRYSLLFEIDAQHRAVLRMGQGGVAAASQTYVLSAQQRELAVELAVGNQAASAAASSLALVRHGVGHILSGLDHVLFLLALLLPAVIRRGPSEETTRTQIRRLLGDVVRVVTAFTVAHSLTLGLAALGLVSMSADIIEPAIAASVAIAALDNLWPVLGADRWSIAFALGLLHGFGFSSALSDLGLQGAALLRGLLSFNLGVELGQLAIVLVFVPVAYALRNARFYRLLCLRGGSVAIAAISLAWLVERVRGG